jgi:circadian clock protein KaiC
LTQIQSTARIPTRVRGLDALIQGGMQSGDLMLLSGGSGTGKTIFSSQFVYNAAKEDDEHAVFATFEEDISSLKRNMLQFGMDLGALEKEKKVKLLDLESLEGRGMGSNIEILLGALDEVRGKRLAVDSLTAFLSGAKEKFDYSFLMHLIYKTLKREGITTLMTVSKLESGDFIGGGIEEFVADGIFQLENYVTKNMELRTRFIIRKMRGTDHSRKFHTVAFTPSGIEILSFSE